MTVKEILKIANNDHLMFILINLSKSIKNDCCRTAIELKNEEKARKIMAKKIKEELENKDN